MGLQLVASGCDATQGRARPREEAETETRSAASPARYRATQEVVNDHALEFMRAEGNKEIVGMSLALIDEDEVAWATGWGHADVDAKLRASPRTVYDVGSVTKVITVAAVLQAVEAGSLRLDAPLSELLPELHLDAGAEAEITLEDLLTHQSGLPSDWFFHSLSTDPPPFPELVQEVRGMPLAAPPRTRTLYSNLGMSLAGLALARATGHDYETQVTESLLRPAGMRTAHFVGGPEPQAVRLPSYEGPRGAGGLAGIERAAAYRHGEARTNPQFRLSPAGGMRASVLDLAAFARLVLGRGRVDGRQLLSPESVDAMLSPHNLELPLDLGHSFGYAWFLDRHEFDWLGSVASHGGRTFYHHAVLIILPEHGLAVAVAANSLGAGKAVETLAAEALLMAVYEKHGLESPGSAPPPEPDAPTKKRVRAFVRAHGGDYATSIGLSTITEKDGAPWSRSRVGHNELQLLPADDTANGSGLDAAVIESMPGAVLRFLEREERALMAIERDGRLHRAAVRLDAPANIPEAWRARAGRWEQLRQPGEVSTIREPTIEVSGGRLRLSFLGLLEEPPLPVVLVLDPIDDRTARIAGLARGQGSLIEVRGEGERERIWWSGRELGRLR